MLYTVGLLLYSSIASAAAILLLFLLWPSIRQGNRRAAWLALALFAFLPTLLGLLVKTAGMIVPTHFSVFWWPFADWAVLVFLAVLLHLALDAYLAPIHAQEKSTPTTAIRAGEATNTAVMPGWWIRLYPFALSLPVIAPIAMAEPVSEPFLMLVGMAFGVVMVKVLWLQRNASTAAYHWSSGLLTALLIWVVVDGVLPMLPRTPIPETIRAAAAAMPHALVILALFQAAIDERLVVIGHTLYTALPSSFAFAFAFLGGGAAGKLLASPWNLWCAMAAALCLFLVMRHLLTAWQRVGTDSTSVPSQRIQELQRLAYEDALTGLLNRRAFDEQLQYELARPAQSPQTITLILFDLDRFKQINDNRGHSEGDKVLSLIGRLLRKHKKDGELVYRIGGDEFAMIVRGLDENQVHQRCHEVQTLLLNGLDHQRVKASFGYSLLELGPAEEAVVEAGEWFRAADMALYAEKKNRLPLMHEG